jgi:hypothetical protein
MANPRANKDIEDNTCYKYTNYLKIIFALYKWKDNPDFGLGAYTSIQEDPKKQRIFSNYHDYHGYMLQGITFSMVDTFKANLAKEMKEMHEDFEHKVGSAEYLSNSPVKVSRHENEGGLGLKLKLGDKQMKILQKELDDKKLTKSDILEALTQTKHLNVLPYTLHSRFSFFFSPNNF